MKSIKKGLYSSVLKNRLYFLMCFILTLAVISNFTLSISANESASDEYSDITSVSTDDIIDNIFKKLLPLSLTALFIVVALIIFAKLEHKRLLKKIKKLDESQNETESQSKNEKNQ